MTDPKAWMNSVAGPWSAWVLDKAQMGLIVLDQQARLVYVNDWIKRYADLHDVQWQGVSLFDVFMGMRNSYLESVLQRSQATGFAAFLSNSLHPSPFPLYRSISRRATDGRIKQSIHIIPMGQKEAAAAGVRYTMIQVNDVTQAVNRESLLKAQATALHGIARMDALTGIGNRRHFDETLAQEFGHALRSHASLGVILVDIDHFKLYNDTYGHVEGDEALKLTAGALRRACHRSRDIAARYGGEELALILPGTDADGVGKVAFELQREMQDLHIVHPQNIPSGRLTLSMGLVVLSPTGRDSPQKLIEMADQALYRAKELGRNRICRHTGLDVEELQPPTVPPVPGLRAVVPQH